MSLRLDMGIKKEMEELLQEKSWAGVPGQYVAPAKRYLRQVLTKDEKGELTSADLERWKDSAALRKFLECVKWGEFEKMGV